MGRGRTPASLTRQAVLLGAERGEVARTQRGRAAVNRAASRATARDVEAVTAALPRSQRGRRRARG